MSRREAHAAIAKLLALIMGVEGVENCSLTGPGADIAAGKTSLPVAGTINISEVM